MRVGGTICFDDLRTYSSGVDKLAMGSHAPNRPPERSPTTGAGLTNDASLSNLPWASCPSTWFRAFRRSAYPVGFSLIHYSLR